MTNSMETDAGADADTNARQIGQPGELDLLGKPADSAEPAEPRQTVPGASGDDLKALVQRYKTYLRGQRGLSDNTVRVYLADLDSFLRFIAQKGHSLIDMNRRLARSYLAWLATEGRETVHPYSGRKQQEGYARVSIVRKLTALRSFYQFLVQQGRFKHSPVPSGRSLQVKVEKPLPSFIGKQEAVRLLETPNTDDEYGARDRAILEVLYSCGVRLAEIAGMDLPDINFAQRQILVEGKGSKERWVLFGQPTEKSLQHYLQEVRPQLLDGPTEALFLNRYGKRLSRRSIEKLVRHHAAQAGLRDGIHPHTLRHSFASHMLEGAADLRVIQELLGHSSPTTTQIYTHITKQEAKAAYLNFHPRAGPEE
jgi:site-specific recombinase XerD